MEKHFEGKREKMVPQHPPGGKVSSLVRLQNDQCDSAFCVDFNRDWLLRKWPAYYHCLQHT